MPVWISYTWSATPLVHPIFGSQAGGRPRTKPAQIRFVPVALTGEQRARYEAGSWRVPKPELVATLDVALTTGRLKVAQGLPLWSAFREELLAFRRKIDLKTAHVCFEHHTASGHGDLVIATALAVWKTGNTK
jgi:hypothetical protein